MEDCHYHLDYEKQVLTAVYVNCTKEEVGATLRKNILWG